MSMRILLLALVGLAGCSSKLETGYEPKRLDMSSGEIKALYAEPFSPEAEQAESAPDATSRYHRPGTN